MAQFISFNIVNSLNAASLLTEGPQLVNVDHIESCSYVAATGVLTIILRPYGSDTTATGPALMGRVITSTVTTTTNGTAGVPTITSGINAPDKAVYAAMTSNPGGARSTVTCIDQAAVPLRCYFQTWAIATNAAI